VGGVGEGVEWAVVGAAGVDRGGGSDFFATLGYS